MNSGNICWHYDVRSLGCGFPGRGVWRDYPGARRVGGVCVIRWVALTLPPGPSEPSPSSAELALSRSLERDGRCLRPLASSWARALCKLLSSLTVSGTAKSRSVNRVKGQRLDTCGQPAQRPTSSGHLHSYPGHSTNVSKC